MRYKCFALGGLAAIVFILNPRPALSGNGAVAVACPEPASRAHYDVGVTDNSIRLGTTMPLTLGPASFYGAIATGEQAYFDYVNKTQGGVNGREIIFEVKDDNFNQTQTLIETKKLVEDVKVFLMFGGLGSQTQLAVRNYLNEQKVPQLFVASGLTKFSADYDSLPYTIGWQPQYQVESRIYAQSVLTNHPDAKIGVLYDDSEEWKDYRVGLKEGLGPDVSMIVAEQGVSPSASLFDVFAAVAKLKSQNVDTVFIFAGPAHSVQTMIGITNLSWTPNIYLNAVSNLPRFMELAALRGAALQNVTSLGFLKDPTDPTFDSDADMLLYRQILSDFCQSQSKTCNSNDPLYIYGFAAAYTMVDVLQRAGSNLTRCNVMNEASNRLKEMNYNANPFLISGVWVKTTPSDHFPITQGQLITWSGTRWESQGDIIDGTLRSGDDGEE